MARPRTEPDLTLGPLRLHVHGRQFPGHQDFWDGNWLVVTAEIDHEGRRTRYQGPCLRTAELARWLAEIETLERTLKGTACLDPVEPNLEVDLEATALGQVEVHLEVTPDTTQEGCRAHFILEPARLSELTEALRRILERFPVRSAE